MIGTIDVEIQAANPNMPLHPWRAFVNSPSSLRLRNVPKRIGDWHITAVKIVAAYPNGEIKTADCVLTGGVWVGTVAGTATSGTSTNGYTVFADGVDERGNAVTGYILGKGDIVILNADGTLNPDAPSYYVHLFDTQPETPHEGDLYPTENGYTIWQGGEGVPLGITQSQMETYVTQAISGKADKSQLATKRDLTDLHVATNPQADNGEIIVAISGNEIDTRLTCTYDGSGWTGDGYIGERYPYHLEITAIDENIYDLIMSIDTEDFQRQITLSPPNYAMTITFASPTLGDLSLAIFPLGTNLATEIYAVQNNGGVAKVQSISLSAYEAISTPDPATLYVIPEESGNA